MLKVSHAYYLWSNSGLYWIVIFYKTDFKIAHIRRFTSYTLSSRLSQIIICSGLLLINASNLQKLLN